ncbi:hypothetical protein H6A65_14015 [Mediterraneibacter glycyrrhizinilyticus]|uniref:hypothetical protein n=1 Tax=Mediterraneibacter glycyrrhizinilyticus TaxID=342942 RepID=UPI0019608A92|nr:hypothetical protein [Mediterraneibacter glycyrrhizinilyticus]MBM6752593.1 hypothetical protein [Mediterraneibacter glycyrrhizinilyticus]
MNKNRVVNGIVFDTAKVNCMWGTEMYISIKELPEELTDVVNNAVEEKIKEYCVENKNVMEKYGQKWSNKQILEPQLWVYIPDFMNSGSDGKIEYELDIFFTDAEDETLFDTVRIDIGLHTTEELRNVIVEAFRGIIK